jgi:hypothetical protein
MAGRSVATNKRTTRSAKRVKTKAAKRRQSGAAGSDESAGNTESAIQRLDREVAATALRKINAGEQPTGRERAALRRYEAAQEETLRWRHYRAIPQRHWLTMSGRQAKVVNEQARRYDIPFSGAHIDLLEVIPAFHDFLARNARKLAATNGEDDALMQGPVTPALERYRAARADRERLAYQRDLGKWIERSLVHERLVRLANILRQTGEALQRQHGSDALAILQEALADFERETERAFAPPGENGAKPGK